jgi:hypothetical protein
VTRVFDETLVYALDIETVNGLPPHPGTDIPSGLDPRSGRIASIAVVCSDGEVWFRRPSSRKDGEANLLAEFCEFYISIEAGMFATWNGGAFDWPYLTYRMQETPVGVPWELKLSRDRQPKYSPLPTFEGVYKVQSDWGHDHVDLVYPFRDHPATAGMKHSLKPLSKAFGFGDDWMENDSVNAVAAHSLPGHQLAAYNIHDCQLVLDLYGKAQALGIDLQAAADDSLLWV